MLKETKKKKLMRVYDKREGHINTGDCYFLILPDNCDIDDDYDYQQYIYPNLARISGMRWQSYTSYMVGVADVTEDEMFWSEITGYELKECKIDISRVKNIDRYKLPEDLLNI